MGNIVCKVESILDTVEFKDVLIRSKLEERRPVADLDRIKFK
jgi:hypothetical protein